MSTTEERHGEGVARVRELLASSGLTSLDELRLDHLRGHPRPPRSRVAFSGPGGGVGYVLLDTLDGRSSEVKSSSARTGVTLGPLLSKRGGVRVTDDFDSATNADVARAVELLAALPAAVRAPLLAFEPSTLEGDDVAQSLHDPETGDAASVLAATTVLSELASGVPLEWVLRRFPEGPS